MAKTKKIYILIASLLIVLIVIYIFFSSRIVAEADKTPDGFVLQSADLIPIDAIAIFHFNDINTSLLFLSDTSGLFPPLFPQESSVGKFIALSGSSGGEITMSFHYSAKNEVSPIVILDLPSDPISEKESDVLLRKLGAVNESSYNGFEIFSGSGLKIFKNKNKIVASTSLILIQSSIRHYKTKSSIMDNHDFCKVLAHTPKGDHRLFVNIQQAGKLFSGYTDYRYWRYSDFTSKITSWISFTLDRESKGVSLAGKFFNYRGKTDFSEIFSNATGETSEAWSLLPYNTYGALIIAVDDFKILLDSYYEYRRSFGVIDEAAYERAKEWFLLQKPAELALALIPYKSESRWVTLIRSEGKKRSRRKVASSFEYKGALATLFGKSFSYNPERFVVTSGNWQLIGDEDMIREFAAGDFEKYTMEDFMEQGEAHGKFTELNAPFTIVANVSMMQDSVASLFRDPARERITARLHKKNFQTMFFRIFPDVDNNEVHFSISVTSQIVSNLREPDADLVNIPDTVRVPVGPFLISKGQKEKMYLEQMQDYKLRLIYTDGRGIWAIPFTTPLRGFVEEVDYFSNNKFQMLFASGNKLYLLDKSGRYTGQFPKSVDSLILLGPKVYEHHGGFSIMLLHTDNTLRLYDKNCKPVEGWKDISTDEMIEGFPELMKIGESQYWILRTRLRTLIYKFSGEAIGDLSGKNSLMPDTKIRILSGTKVAVTTRKGKEASLDLENGEIKKLRKRGKLF
ncbi:MAG: hypothetical protein VB022_01625 [Rikenellaceae bacterium]|nr:hypothetical protein [Rikenellaceae bacterium]